MGQQAIVLCVSPSKPNPVFKVFGAAPLENVVSAGAVPRNSTLTTTVMTTMRTTARVLINIL